MCNLIRHLRGGGMRQTHLPASLKVGARLPSERKMEIIRKFIESGALFIQLGAFNYYG